MGLKDTETQKQDLKEYALTRTVMIVTCRYSSK